MMFFKKKPEIPDIEGMSLPGLKNESAKISDRISEISGLKWKLLFCQARIFSAKDKKAEKLERKKMKGYVSSLSGLDQLRIRKNMIAARMLELTGGLPTEEKPQAAPPDMTLKHEPRVIDLRWRVPMSQKMRRFAI